MYVIFVIKVFLLFGWIVFLFGYRIGLFDIPIKNPFFDVFFQGLSGKSNNTKKIENKSNLINNNLKITNLDINLSDVYQTQLKQGNTTIQQMRKMISDKSSMYEYESVQLEQARKKTKDKKILAALVQYLSDHFLFKKAYYYLQQFNNDAHLFLPGNTILYVILNSEKLTYNDENYIQQVKDTIVAMEQRGYLDKDDKSFYFGLLSFLQYDLNETRNQRKNISSLKYKNFIKNVNDILVLKQHQRDVPDYYYTSLIDLHIIRQGYFRISQQVAIQVLTKNGKYILPYQILAYSHFIMGDWAIASDYLTKLKKTDYGNENKYNFLLGISSFWQKKYTDSIISFKQTFLPEYEGDRLRYLALSYDKINDENNLMQTFTKILGQENIQSSDFYLFFEKIFYQPLIKKEPYILFEKNKTTSIFYVQKCFKKINAKENFVCDYGQAGLLLAQGKNKQAGYILQKITKKRQKSYLRTALGDWYFAMGKKSEAQQSYIKALSLPTTEQQKIYAKQKLSEIIK